MKCLLACDRFARYEHVARAMVLSDWCCDVSEIYGLGPAAQTWAIRNRVPLNEVRLPVTPGDQTRKRVVKQALDVLGPDGYVVAVWDGRSKLIGTLIEVARATGLKVYVGEAQ